MKTKFKLFCFLTMICLLFSIFSIAKAGDVPTRTTITNVSSTAQTYTVPAFANGSLVKIQAYDTSGTNDTLTVTKVVAVSSTRSMTNACATAALVANATYSLATTVSNEQLVPGDILRFTFGTVTGQVSITRLVSNP
jgi:hypothetical protein